MHSAKSPAWAVRFLSPGARFRAQSRSSKGSHALEPARFPLGRAESALPPSRFHNSGAARLVPSKPRSSAPHWACPRMFPGPPPPEAPRPNPPQGPNKNPARRKESERVGPRLGASPPFQGMPPTLLPFFSPSFLFFSSLPPPFSLSHLL